MEEFRPEAVTYEILERVGEGLTSTVYKAVRVDSRGHSRQIVALKVLKEETTIPILRREFETLAAITSRHCCRVLAWENSGGKPALVLEWIEGETLDRLAGLLSTSEITEIAAQIARGLSDLRESGLHHGDLHPRNVLVDESGRVRLVDFGTGEMRAREIRGVPEYLSPEIWRGEETSFSSDLYALGAIVHDLRSGRMPSEGRRDLTREGDPLLSPDPNERSLPADLVSHDESRRSLACRVRESLVSKRSVIRTRVIAREPSRVAWVATVAASVLAAFSTLSISVRAEAPPEIAEKPASLEIRSMRWLEIEVNGKSAGYAPIRIADLKPGFHRVKWKGIGTRGEARIRFASGSVLRLAEKDLAKLTGELKR